MSGKAQASKLMQMVRHGREQAARLREKGTTQPNTYYIELAALWDAHANEIEAAIGLLSSSSAPGSLVIAFHETARDEGWPRPGREGDW